MSILFGYSQLFNDCSNCDAFSFTAMKKVSIIGLGWLGKPLAVGLMAEGNKVMGSVTSTDKAAELMALGIETHVINFFSEVHSTAQHPLQAADVVIVTVPPLKGLGEEKSLGLHQRIAAFVHSSSATQVCYCSSTSVYPDVEKVMTEEDADTSSHIFHLEEIYRATIPHLTILRFGGLIGQERHPILFLAGKKNVEKPYAPVNLTYQDDALLSIMSLMISETIGTYNAVSPQHPARLEFYTNAANSFGVEPPLFDMTDSRKGKQVSSDKLLQLGILRS